MRVDQSFEFKVPSRDASHKRPNEKKNISLSIFDDYRWVDCLIEFLIYLLDMRCFIGENYGSMDQHGQMGI